MNTRSRRGLGFALAAVAGLAAGGSPSTAMAAKLRWKFTEGETLRYRTEQNSATSQVVDTRENKTTVTQTIDSSWAVGSVSADGVAEVTVKYDRLRTKISTPFGAFDYDSASKKDPEGAVAERILPTFKALASAEMRCKISPKGEVSDLKLSDNLVKLAKQAEGGPGAMMLSEEGFKKTIQESCLAFPEQDVEAGKTWTGEDKAPLAPGASLKADKTYTYVGGDTVSLEVKVSLVAPDLPKTVDVKVESPENKGTYHFDFAKGHLVSAETRQKLTIRIKSGEATTVQNVETVSGLKLVDGPSSETAK